jgi:hypothetical protein
MSITASLRSQRRFKYVIASRCKRCGDPEVLEWYLFIPPYNGIKSLLDYINYEPLEDEAP